MQGLTEIIFWYSNIIIKLAWNRSPMCMDYPQCAITTRNIRDNDPNSAHIVNLIEGNSLSYHFAIYRINMFWSTRYISLNPSRTNNITESLYYFPYLFFAVHPP